MKFAGKIAMIATLLIASAAAANAQIPTRTQIYFDINVPYAMEMGGYNLPPGHYVMQQDSQNSNIFRLYQHDLAREPIAVIYTTRGRYWADRHGNTRFQLDVDESTDSNNEPVLRGFKIGQDDPWEVLSVKVKHDSVMTRIASR